MQDFVAQFKFDQRLGIIYVGCQFLVWLQLMLLKIALIYQLAGFLLCLLHGFCFLYFGVRSADLFSQIAYKKDAFYVFYKNSWQKISVKDGSRVFVSLIVLKFKLDGNFWPHTLYLTRASLPPDIHRQMRIILNFKQLA